MNPEIKKSLDIITQGTVQVTPLEELIKKLESGKKLTIKLGMDPTAPDLHLGHAVVLSKMKQFQELGHHIIFLIGDFTARVGDPTGKSKTRPPLSQEEITHNMKTYFEQVSRILDPQKVVVKYNSEWLSALSTETMVKLCAKVTVARIIEREDFAKRLSENQPIGFHELLYPLFQGYDSVVLDADVELGGTDQTFNLLMGRFLQEQYHKPAQVIVTTPLLEGLDGVNKMSKSLGNAIGLAEPATEAFGKLMSISDVLMWRYYSLLLNKTDTEINELQSKVASQQLHPMDLKKQMAHGVVAKFWSQQDADKGLQHFEGLFQKKDYSQAKEIDLLDHSNPIRIVDLIKSIETQMSSSEIRRLIEAGAIRINDEQIKDIHMQIQCDQGTIIKVGKHKIYKIK